VDRSYFDLALSEIEHETRFADLLILSGERFYETIGGSNTEYLADALKAAECPVLVVPETCELPLRNILAYDGSASSVFAIKQFAYVLPELCQNETLLVYVATNDEEALPDEAAIEELAGQHFKNLQLLKLNVTTKKEFATWIEANSNAMLVSGSYGRSFFSQLVRRSFVTDVIARHKLPVFITHT
jgi:nucleotide-binding universal stress UspA family protein